MDDNFKPKYFLRSALLSKDFKPQDDGNIAAYEVSKIKSRISECTDIRFDEYDGLVQAVLLMISCGKKDDIYSLMQSTYIPSLFPKEPISAIFMTITHGTIHTTGR